MLIKEFALQGELCSVFLNQLFSLSDHLFSQLKTKETGFLNISNHICFSKGP